MMRFLISLIVLVVSGLPAGAQGKRVALVIGNSAYQYTPILANPKHDAEDVTVVLKNLGFEVYRELDVTKAAMDRAIHSFAEALEGAHAALFFYAGHGVQVSGQNYLIPVDAKLRTAASLDFEMVRLDVVQRVMERETRTNLIFLDACRDNPLARNLSRALGTRSTMVGRGLAAVESGEGTLISFSTQPGNVALDGIGRNSPYASALIKHVATPGEDLPTILINVRNDVMAATDRRQVPWEHSALTAKVYFTPPKATTPTVDQQIELAFWSSVKDSTSPAVLSTYLERYPKGEFATVARALIEHYEQRARVEQAKIVEEQRRVEEQRKVAEVQRLEEERRLREAALAKQRKDARDAKSADHTTGQGEAENAETLARAEALQRARQEELEAKVAAKNAEEQRLAATKAFDEATKTAEKTLAAKRDAAKAGNPAQVAALPKLELGVNQFDGIWQMTWRGPTCPYPDGRTSHTYPITISNGKITAFSGSLSGNVSPNGSATWTTPARTDRKPVKFQGIFRGNTASGRFERADGKCGGTFTAKR